MGSFFFQEKIEAGNHRSSFLSQWALIGKNKTYFHRVGFICPCPTYAHHQGCQRNPGPDQKIAARNRRRFVSFGGAETQFLAYDTTETVHVRFDVMFRDISTIRHLSSSSPDPEKQPEPVGILLLNPAGCEISYLKPSGV
jgi:hypothetical protein